VDRSHHRRYREHAVAGTPVEPVRRDGAGLDRFLRVADAVYRDDGHWVAPLRGVSRKVLSRANPFFEHAEAQLFVARRAGRDIGRIAAILDRRHNQRRGERTAAFGFFECENDPATARALFTAAHRWAAGRGMDVLRGPLNPSMDEECGLLVEGFDSPPAFMTTYNPRYYVDLLEGQGLRKAKDLWAYSLAPGPRHVAGLEPLAERTLRRLPDLVVRPLRRRDFDGEVARMQEVYNASWQDNWGFVPLTDAEFAFKAERLAPLIVEPLALIAERAGEPVGLMLSLPDYNQALKPLRGRLWPLGWLRFRLGARRIRTGRTVLLGVKREYRALGIETVMLLQSFRWALHRGFTNLEQSWVVEDNRGMQRYLEMLGAKVYKRYRLYEQPVRLTA
jgi:GNAT superfamily N-acetyltransferase